MISIDNNIKCVRVMKTSLYIYPYIYIKVVEASEEVTTRGNAYDPDEIESEQRERKMRKALNRKFQEYTVKVEEVAKKHGFDSLEFDIPYKVRARVCVFVCVYVCVSWAIST
jgi:hypothetical protein